MKELLEFLAKSLVDNPEGVVISEEPEENGTINFKLTVSQSDMGRVIGKQGRIAKAIRTVMKSAAAREGKKVNIEIVENL